MIRTLLVAMMVSLSACSLAAKGPGVARVAASGRDAREVYAHGESMMQRGAWDKAQADFQELRNFHRDDPLSVLAKLALADIHYRKGEFAEAQSAYEEFARYHPRHEALDLVTYRMGLTIWRRAPKVAGRDQSPTVSAVRAWTPARTSRDPGLVLQSSNPLATNFDWTAFEARFPESEYIEKVEKLRDRARNRLAARDLFTARFYAKRKAWAAVKGRAEDLVRLFPGSRHGEEGLALLARALHSIGESDDAILARDKLAEEYPGSRYLGTVDRSLAKPAGSPPEEEIFVRPYRMPGLGVPQPTR